MLLARTGIGEGAKAGEGNVPTLGKTLMLAVENWRRRNGNHYLIIPSLFGGGTGTSYCYGVLQFDTGFGFLHGQRHSILHTVYLILSCYMFILPLHAILLSVCLPYRSCGWTHLDGIQSRSTGLLMPTNFWHHALTSKVAWLSSCFWPLYGPSPGMVLL